MSSIDFGGATFRVKFWGVRGSVPAPMTEDSFQKTLRSLAVEYAEIDDTGKTPLQLVKFLEFVEANRGNNVHGGNTSCVEVLSNNQSYPPGRIVLDMGTGLRELGNSLMRELFECKGLKIAFLLSHVHWDHIQGLPFFSPLYMSKDDGFQNSWNFFGGTDWQRKAETCIQGQMDPPTFPVSWREIEAITHEINFSTVWDKLRTNIEGVVVSAGKLHHPQETYGWRLEKNGKVITYATDQEPFDPRYPDPPLLRLAKGADLLITDCQYSDAAYHGTPPPVRHNWGHSYPSAVAHVAAQAGVKSVALFHHDPSATRDDISTRVRETRAALGSLGYDCNVFAAWEGLEIFI